MTSRLSILQRFIFNRCKKSILRQLLITVVICSNFLPDALLSFASFPISCPKSRMNKKQAKKENQHYRKSNESPHPFLTQNPARTWRCSSFSHRRCSSFTGCSSFSHRRCSSFSHRSHSKAPREFPTPFSHRSVPLIQSTPFSHRSVPLLQFKSAHSNCFVVWDSSLFGVEHDVPLYLSHNDVLGILHGNVWLSISIIQFWILLLHKLSMDMGNDDVYGFLEPQSIQYMGNKENEVSKYIPKHMRESNKKIYLGAYHHGNHWQLLIIIPNEALAVWLCSLHARPDAAMKAIVHSVVSPFKMLGGIHNNKSKHNLIWLYPKCNKQVGSWECGYYVMYWMLTIIRASVKNSWQEIFNDTSALPQTSIEEIRTQWARHFLEYNR